MVEHAVNDRSTLPILTNVLVQTLGDELILTATDLDVGIQCRFPLTPPHEEGAVALPARKLTTIVRELPDEPIVLEAKKNSTAMLSCGRSSFRVPGLPAEDFPVLPTASGPEGVRVPQETLKTLIQQTAYAMSMEETRFILNGALLSTQKKQIALIATDGRRLAVGTAPLAEAPRGPLNVVVPAKTMRELGRLLQADPEDVLISPLQDNQLALRFGAVTMVTRLIEGQFPPYEKVIPPPSKQQARCPREALTSAIRRASLMTTASSQAVVFELAPNRLVVSKESAETGSAREELEIGYAGDAMTVAFNPEFWLDVLKVLDGDEVTIELGGAERPAVIRQAGLTYVVLPMKVS
jgi:DNA polymerase-3 subunit beta